MLDLGLIAVCVWQITKFDNLMQHNNTYVTSKKSHAKNLYSRYAVTINWF